MIIFHTLCGLTALISGLVVILLPKGNRQHRTWGSIYIVSMLVLCISSYFIYELFGNFGAFHILAGISLVTIIAGWLTIRIFQKNKKIGQLHGHYKFMLFSYVGLVMATGSHFMGYLFAYLKSYHLSQGLIFAICALTLWVIPYLIGSVLIYRNWRFFKAKYQKILKIV